MILDPKYGPRFLWYHLFCRGRKFLECQVSFLSVNIVSPTLHDVMTVIVPWFFRGLSYQSITKDPLHYRFGSEVPTYP